MRSSLLLLLLLTALSSCDAQHFVGPTEAAEGGGGTTPTRRTQLRTALRAFVKLKLKHTQQQATVYISTRHSRRGVRGTEPTR